MTFTQDRDFGDESDFDFYRTMALHWECSRAVAKLRVFAMSFTLGDENPESSEDE